MLSPRREKEASTNDDEDAPRLTRRTPASSVELMDTPDTQKRLPSTLTADANVLTSDAVVYASVRRVVVSTTPAADTVATVLKSVASPKPERSRA